MAEKVLHLQEVKESSLESANDKTHDDTSLGKRKRSIMEEDPLVSSSLSFKKCRDTEDELYMSGGLQDPRPPKASDQCLDDPEQQAMACSKEQPPAVRLRMTVTSGFYVRSLAHDLGKALNSLACMSDLVRVRQERFEVGQNVLQWSDIDRGEDVWAPKLEANLQAWRSRKDTSRQEIRTLQESQNGRISQPTAS